MVPTIRPSHNVPPTGVLDTSSTSMDVDESPSGTMVSMTPVVSTIIESTSGQTRASVPPTPFGTSPTQTTSVVFGSADQVTTDFRITNTGPPHPPSGVVRGQWAFDEETGAILHRFNCHICTAYRDHFAEASQQPSAPLDTHITVRHNWFWRQSLDRVDTEKDLSYQRGIDSVRYRLDDIRKENDRLKDRVADLNDDCDEKQKELDDERNRSAEERRQHESVVADLEAKVVQLQAELREEEYFARNSIADKEWDETEKAKLKKKLAQAERKARALERMAQGVAGSSSGTLATPPAPSSHMRDVFNMSVPVPARASLSQRLSTVAQDRPDTNMDEEHTLLPYNTPSPASMSDTDDAKSRKRKRAKTKSSKPAPPLLMGPQVLREDGTILSTLNHLHGRTPGLTPETWTPQATRPIWDYVVGHGDITRAFKGPWGPFHDALVKASLDIPKQYRNELHTRVIGIHNSRLHQAYTERRAAPIASRSSTTRASNPAAPPVNPIISGKPGRGVRRTENERYHPGDLALWKTLMLAAPATGAARKRFLEIVRNVSLKPNTFTEIAERLVAVEGPFAPAEPSSFTGEEPFSEDDVVRHLLLHGISPTDGPQLEGYHERGEKFAVNVITDAELDELLRYDALVDENSSLLEAAPGQEVESTAAASAVTLVATPATAPAMPRDSNLFTDDIGLQWSSRAAFQEIMAGGAALRDANGNPPDPPLDPLEEDQDL